MNGGVIQRLCRLNNYVVVLLEYCLLYYIVVSICQKAKAKKEVIDLILIAGVVISSVIMYFFFDGDDWCWERWGLVYGILIYRFYPRVIVWFDHKRTIKIGTFLVLSLIAGAAYLKYKPVFFYGGYLLKLVLGIFIIALLFAATSNRTWGNKVITFLGAISYEVYLSHGFIMHVLGNHTNLPSGMFVLLTVASTIIFSWLIHFYISKPLVKKFRTQ